MLLKADLRFCKLVIDLGSPAEVSRLTVVIAFALRPDFSKRKADSLVGPVAHRSASQTIVAVNVRGASFEEISSFALKRFTVAHSGMALIIVRAHSTVVKILGNLFSRSAILSRNFSMNLAVLPFRSCGQVSKVSLRRRCEL